MLLSPSNHYGTIIEVWPLTCSNAKSLFQQYVPNYISPFHLHALFWKLGMIKVSNKGKPVIIADQLSELEKNEISYNFLSFKVKVNSKRIYEKYRVYQISIKMKCSAGHTQKDGVEPKTSCNIIDVFPTLNKLVEEYTIVTTMKTPEPIIPSVNIMKTIEQVVIFRNKLDKPITCQILSNTTHKHISIIIRIF